MMFIVERDLKKRLISYHTKPGQKFSSIVKPCLVQGNNFCSIFILHILLTNVHDSK